MTGLTLVTESGSWNPIVWILSLMIILIIVIIIRSRGSKRYKHGTDQTKPFFSGNVAPDENIKSSNIYWGFFEAMKKYYKWLLRAHTGIVNDYIYSFVLLLVVILAAMTLGGLL